MIEHRQPFELLDLGTEKAPVPPISADYKQWPYACDETAALL